MLDDDECVVDMPGVVAAWQSDRADAVRTDGRLFYRLPETPRPAPTPCAEVVATWNAPDGGTRLVSSRVAPANPCARRERFAFFDSNWLRSFYVGHECIDACAVALDVEEAERLAQALQAHSQFTDVHIRRGAIAKWLGSAEFVTGLLSYPPGFVSASQDLSRVVGEEVYWVVW